MPPGVSSPAPNLYQPSSPADSERSLWRRHTIASLEFAQRVGSKVLVTHLGSVFFFLLDPARRVEALEDSLEFKDLRNNAEFQEEITTLLGKLRKAAPKHYARIQDCLADVTAKAQEMGVKFACENREGLLELPLDEHMDAFLASVDDLAICGGWHDTGHACIKHCEGVIDHAQFLEKNHARPARLPPARCQQGRQGPPAHRHRPRGLENDPGRSSAPTSSSSSSSAPKLTKEQVLESKGYY